MLINTYILDSDCGIVAHRTCAATGLPSCRPTVEKPISIQSKSVFGQGLCIQFNLADMPAPPIVSISILCKLSRREIIKRY